MTTAATIAAELILDASGFSKGIDGATKSADSFESKMQSLGSKMQKIGAGMTLALTVPILAFGKAAVDEAMQSEAAFADLDAVIKSTGGSAGVTAKSVEDYANKMQLLTKFSDDQIVSGSAMMLTFTNIGEEVFPAASDAMLDMAQKFGMDLPQAAITLGKALNDPIAGIGALRRIGVQLTDEQQAQVEGFMAVGDVASAQGVILAELEKEIGGVAEAYGSTAAGQLAIFNNRLSDLKESLGKAIIPALINLMTAITPVIQAIASAPPWVQTMIVGFLGLVALAGPLIGFIGTILSIVSSLSTLGITFAGISTAVTAISTLFTATLIPAIIAALPIIALLAAAALLVYMVWKNWDQLKTTVMQLGAITKNAFSNMASDAKSKFAEIQNSAGALGVKIGSEIASGITKAKSFVAGFVTGAKQAWSNIGNAFKSVFQNIVGVAKSVFGAISSAIGQMIGYVRQLISALMSIKLPSALTPGSPTPFEIGLRGINGEMGKLASKSIPSMNKSFNASNGITGVGGGQNVNITDNRRFSGGMSADQLRVALDNKLQGLAGAL